MQQKIDRYGPQSANSMTNSEDPHSIIYQEWSPSFLTHPLDLHDPWTPPFKGSPKVWPREASYVCGSKLKANCRVEREAHIVSLMSTLNSTKDDVELLQTKLSKLNSLQSSKYKSTMNEVRKVRSRAYDKYGARKESRLDRVKDSQLKYGRGLTVIRATDNDIKALKDDHRGNQRSAMKWTEIFSLCKAMKSSSYRKPGFQDLEALYVAMVELTESQNRTLAPWMISRSEFVSLTLTKTFGVANRRNLNRIFSAFDPDLNDDADVREIAGGLRIMWKPAEPTIAKLGALFSLFEDESQEDCAQMSHVFTILTLCALTRDERTRMMEAIEKSSMYRDDRTFVMRRAFTKALRERDGRLLKLFERQYARCLPGVVKEEISRCS